MKKKTVHLHTYTRHIKGYGIYDYDHGMKLSEQAVLNRIIQELPKKKKYIKHFVNCEFVEKPEYGMHALDNGIGKSPYLIPRGDLIYTLDIYYENR